MGIRVPFWIDPGPQDGYIFPDPDLALREPDGLLAVGGDLATERLLAAYAQGIFPWYSHGQPILWWSPDPRAVLFPERLKVSRSLRKTLRKRPYQVTLDRDFAGVIDGCAAPRDDGAGTWITSEMRAAYIRLHRAGYAHSVESWVDGELVGGLYGVAIGRVFFGESMFTRRTDASKVAFVHLVRQLQVWGFELVDCQISSDHLKSLGAEEIPRGRFLTLLEDYCAEPGVPGRWQLTAEPPEVA
jgi:leucyl/phenylalanyl-tRNA--protein transferase